MTAIPGLYQDFVDGVLTHLPLTTTPNEPQCAICDQTYGQFTPEMDTPLEVFNEMPGIYRKTYVQDIVEPVATPCGHTFCTFCICTWLIESEQRVCPMCRQTIDLPHHLFAWDDNTETQDTAVDGLTISLRVSTPIAEEIYRILKLSMRQLLTTSECKNMPFEWDADAMIADLPKAMVAVARRFHHHDRDDVMPAGLPFLRLHEPMERFDRPC